MSSYEEMRSHIQMDGDEMSTETETIYTAYALTSRGREEIERYQTVEEAVQDMLEMWPEDDEGDIVIEDSQGHAVIHMARSSVDPLRCHVYQNDEYVGAYHCRYEPALGGSVRTIIRKLC